MAVLRPLSQQWFDNSGNPLNGGKIFSYVVNTTTPKTTYTSKSQGSANANPTICDSAGRASIWLDGPTKIVVKTSADVTLYTIDDIGTVDEFTVLQSETSSPASSGQIRLARADTVTWRNNAESADNDLYVDSDDQLRFDGKWTVLNQQGTLSAVVGTGADANLFTYSMPANKMLAGKGIRVSFCTDHTTGTASTTYKLKIGSTSIISFASTDTNDIIYQSTIFNNSGVQNAQTILNAPIMAGTALIAAGGVTTAAENTANALTIAATFSVAATDQVTPKFFLVELRN